MSKWWPFGKKDTSNRQSSQEEDQAYQMMTKELEQQLAELSGESGTRQALLKKWEAAALVLEQSPSTHTIQGKVRAYDLLVGDLRTELGRNLQTGRALEMSGRVDEAIIYYETAVADQMSTRFPYEHLRIIYRRQKQHQDALRVCQAAVANPFLTDKDHAHFQQWVNRLTPLP